MKKLMCSTKKLKEKRRKFCIIRSEFEVISLRITDLDDNKP